MIKKKVRNFIEIAYVILAWNNTEPPNTILPPVNPWDVAPSEPIESTGWANFENFENTLSIENTVSGEKKPCDELKEKISEATAVNLTEKHITCSESVGDGNEKSTDYVDSQVVEMKLPAEEINLNDSKSNEHKMISANENVNSELSVSRYVYSIIVSVIIIT